MCFNVLLTCYTCTMMVKPHFIRFVFGNSTRMLLLHAGEYSPKVSVHSDRNSNSLLSRGSSTGEVWP